MRIVELTRQTRKNILNDLLKRSPNNYGQYEATVNDIIKMYGKMEIKCTV